jgi:hypothetical protein
MALQPGDAEKMQFFYTWARICTCWCKMPWAATQALVVQAANFLGWYSLYYYGSDYWGSYVFGGDASETSDTFALYEEGVREASFAYLMMAFVSIIVSFFLTGWSEIRDLDLDMARS